MIRVLYRAILPFIYQFHVVSQRNVCFQ